MKYEREAEKTDMANRKAFFIAAALALAAGILLLPAGTFARGARGFAAAAHGPVFGLRGPRLFRPALVHRTPARFGWQLHRWHQHRFGGRNRDGAGAIYGGSTAPYYSGDLTGTVPETGPALYAPPAIPSPPAEHLGCLSRGYDIPSESGGVVKVTVTRC
jgi:hypothetical protein